MKDKLFNWIDNAEELAVELETGLTKHPAISPDSGGEGELDKCLFLENWLKAQGITELERYDSPDARAKGGVRPNLIATIKGDKDTERLWIMSHLDIVPPGEIKLWNTDPFTLVYKDGKLIGRGAEDNQQGITASVLAALSYVKQGIKPVRTLKLLFVSDEEVGSVYGIEWLVKNHAGLFRKNDMVLVPDGGDIKGEHIEIAEKNILWLKFVTRGKQGHGSRPDLANNAFLAGSKLVLAIHHELSSEFADKNKLFDPDYSTFQPTKKEANVPNVNTIPGEDVFYLDARVLPQHSTEKVFSKIDRIKTKIENECRVTIEYSIVQRMESKPTAQDAPIVKLLTNAIREVSNANPHPIGIGGGTVASHLRNIGIDCAVWTKTDCTLHQPNEYALLENIFNDAKVMALLAMK